MSGRPFYSRPFRDTHKKYPIKVCPRLLPPAAVREFLDGLAEMIASAIMREGAAKEEKPS